MIVANPWRQLASYTACCHHGPTLLGTKVEPQGSQGVSPRGHFRSLASCILLEKVLTHESMNLYPEVLFHSHFLPGIQI